MKRKALWLLLCIMIIALGTVSVSIGEGTAPEVKSLSLDQALELALKDNSQVGLAALGVEKAELALEQAEFAKKKRLNSLSNPDRKDQYAAMEIDVIPVQANAGKIIAVTGKAYTDNNIKFGVESAYYGVLRGEKMLEVSQAALVRAKEQLKQAEAKFKAGTVAKIEVISAEAQLKSAEATVNEGKTGVKKAQMALNQTLNLNLETPIKLTTKFKFTSAEEIDTEKIFQEMKEKDISYVTANEGYHMSQANWDYHQKYYTKNTFVYREAEYAFKEAEVKLDNAKTTLQLNIKSAYLDLKTANDNYQVLTKSVEQAKEAYRLTKLRYDVGMVTGYDLLGAEASLNQADLALLNALYNYNLAKAKFSCGIFGSSLAGNM